MNFNCTELRRRIDSAVNEYCQEFSDYPPFSVENAYVTGSYAVGKEKESSDFDILLVISVQDNKFAYGVISGNISRAHRHIGECLEEYTPAECDLKIIPVDSGLRNKMDAPHPVEYLIEGLERSGYSSVYDLSVCESRTRSELENRF